MSKPLKFYSTGIIGAQLSVTTIDVAIATANDDARELFSTNAVQLGASTTPIRDARLVGLRFTGFDLTGKTCSMAQIQFTAGLSDTGQQEIEMWCEAASNPGTFVDTTSNISGRTKTASSVVYSVPDWTVNDKGPDQLSPNLATIVNQAIAAGSLTSLVFLVGSLYANDREIVCFEHATLDPAELHMEVF